MEFTKNIHFHEMEDDIVLAEIRYNKWCFYPEKIALAIRSGYVYEDIIDELSVCIDESEFAYDVSGWSYLIGLKDPVATLHTPSQESPYTTIDYLALHSDYEDSFIRLTQKNIIPGVNLWYLCVSLLPNDVNAYKNIWNNHHEWLRNQAWNLDMNTDSYFNYDFLIEIVIHKVADNPMSNRTYINMLHQCLDKEPEHHTSLLSYAWNTRNHIAREVLKERATSFTEEQQWYLMAMGLIDSNYHPKVKDYTACYALGVPYHQLNATTITTEIPLAL